ncbi:hypothetical protein INR49_015890, partial [Caranx melampygus]
LQGPPGLVEETKSVRCVDQANTASEIQTSGAEALTQLTWLPHTSLSSIFKEVHGQDLLKWPTRRLPFSQDNGRRD